MMTAPKITFIGAGSTIFVKNILGDVFHREDLFHSTSPLYVSSLAFVSSIQGSSRSDNAVNFGKCVQFTECCTKRDLRLYIMHNKTFFVSS